MTQEMATPPEYAPAEPDMLIVLGKNIGVRSDPAKIRATEDHLSNESRMNSVAAGLLYRPGIKVLFSSGHTAGEEVPSEAAAMRDYMLARFPEVREGDVVLEEDSVDTAGNAEEIAKILATSTEKHNRIALLSVGYHVENAGKIFESFGIPIDRQISSEDEISKISEDQKAFVERWSNSRKIKAERFKEWIRGRILEFDPDGQLLRKVTEVSRK